MQLLYERLFPRFRPKRELRPQGRGDGWGARITSLGAAGFVVESPETTLLVDPFVTRPSVITPDCEEPICVPPNDARGAVLGPG